MSKLGDSIAKIIFDGIDEWLSQECAKVKARDIIPRWPRPRTTSAWSYSAFFQSFSPGLKERLRDQAATKAYHDGQQRMINKYFEEYRTPQTAHDLTLRNIGAIAKG